MFILAGHAANRRRKLSGNARKATRFWQLAYAAMSAFFIGQSSADAQWTKLTTTTPLGNTGNLVLLHDGSVLVQGAENSQRTSAKWARLTPDTAGNYANGTWAAAGTMNIGRVNFATWVLPNGTLVAAGGEYYSTTTSAGLSWDNTLETYTPLLDKWTKSNATVPATALSSSPSALLSNGTILFGDFFNSKTYLYSPTSDSWGTAGSKAHGGWTTGESWTLLPSGKVVTYNSVGSFTAPNPYYSESFDPSTSSWTDAGPVPISLNNNGDETSANTWAIGPASYLPNGKVIQFGAANQSVIYDPTAPSASAWTVGPSFPAGRGTDLSAAAMMPNGQLLVATSAVPGRASPTKLYVYDYTQSSPFDLVDATPASPSALVADLGSAGAFNRRLLVLPNGHVLLSNGGNTLWDYTPPTISGNPQTTWRPTVNTVIRNTGTNYTLKGLRLTGISMGGCFGGAYNNSVSNFPIIRLKSNSNGVVRYARSSNWTPGISTPGGSTVQQVDFDLPSGAGPGAYTLNVIANGIPSADFAFNVVSAPNYVTVAYDAATQVVTLTGDTDNNTVSVSVKNQVLTVAGSGQTQIKYGASTAASQTIHFGTNVNLAVALTINGSMLAGDDYVSVSAVQGKALSLDLGSGNDTVKVTYSTIGSVSINGGAGFDTFGQSASKLSSVSSSCEVNLP